ncbi:MAG: hypothetical protein AB7I98_03050 [Verrucomicrobiales bacterium]|nr:hypothetical protein [Verrucomicrobiae bacterium]
MLEVNQAKRLMDLEKENTRLKRIVADQMLGMEILQETLEKPGHKRQMAGEFVSAGRCSGRQICRYFRLHRWTFRFRARQLNAWMMRVKAAVRRVSGRYSQWGYANVARLLQGEG